MKTVLPVVNADACIIQCHVLGIYDLIQIRGGNDVCCQYLRISVAHGSNARPQFDFGSLAREVLSCQVMKRLMKLNEYFLEHLLGFQNLSVKFDAFDAIDIEFFQRRF
ncbi:hypothetical protein D3C86_1770940 [compost metagenome]